MYIAQTAQRVSGMGSAVSIAATVLGAPGRDLRAFGAAERLQHYGLWSERHCVGAVVGQPFQDVVRAVAAGEVGQLGAVACAIIDCCSGDSVDNAEIWA